MGSYYGEDYSGNPACYIAVPVRWLGLSMPLTSL